MTTAAAVLSLALGIGANTAIFGVVNALLLRPLPVSDPERLVTVSSGFALGHGFKAGAGMNYAAWRRMYERLGSFAADGFAWAPVRLNLSRGGERDPAHVVFASGGFFSTLGVQPLAGRTFTAADDVPGGGGDGVVAVISHGFWQRRFGGATNAIGDTVALDGVSCTVVGIMPPEFFGIEVGQPFDLVLPLAAEPAVRGASGSLLHPSAHLLRVVLRLTRERTAESAAAALRALQPTILGIDGDARGRVPQFLKDPYVLVPAATGTADVLRRRYTIPLLILLGTAGLILIVGCANLASLMIARAAARRQEMSVRLALGATRWRLARQCLAESAALAAAGAVAALLFAGWAGRAIVAAISSVDARISLQLPLDWRVMSVTAGLTLTAALLFGTAPAILGVRSAALDALTGARASRRTRGGLSAGPIVLQAAVSMVLLVAAALFAATFRNLAATPLGFEPDRVLVVEVDIPRADPDAARRLADIDRLLDAVRQVPGVAAAAASTITPLSDATKGPLFAEPGRVHEFGVSPGFFRTYGVPLRAGRDFGGADGPAAPRAAVVSESYLRSFLRDRGPLGAELREGVCGRDRACTVVGVASDVVFGPPRVGPRPTIYIPLAQAAGLGPPGRTRVSISVRAQAGEPSALGRAVAESLARVDGELTFSFRNMEQEVETALTQERVLATLSGFFAALGLLLSAVGLYGVTAHAVASRRTEIGVRLALGATPRAIARLVLSRMAVVVSIGILAGTLAVFWSSRVVTALLYGLDSHDPRAIAVAALTLAAVALGATSAGLVRVSRIDPAEVLRAN